MANPPHVFYVSDHDDPGQNMPTQLARHLQFWAEQLEIDAAVTLDPLVLTAEQIRQYDLPAAPDKKTKHGGPVVELDALEALHPGELAKIVRAAARPFRDEDLRDELAQTERQAMRDASAQWAEATADLRDDLDELESDVRAVTRRYRPRLATLAKQLDAELKPYRERLDELRDALAELADEGDVIELPERPTAEPQQRRPARALYDSARGWWEQLRAFKARSDASPNGDAP
jgi:hypothetical protein